jgi:RNA polymerase sigma-32 factor
MTTMSLPMVAHEGGLSKYFTEIWKFSLLGRDEEYMLAQRWRHHGDVDAAHKLVTSHLRLVAKIAMKYRRYGLPISDMISEGNIGLMKAVRKFEPERGFRLSTYAMWWIRASITEYILASWSLVKMGTVAAQKKLFFSLRRVKAHLEIDDKGELDGKQVERISLAMNIAEADVVNMNRRMSARDYSLNAPISDDEGALEFQDTLIDGRPSPEEVFADSEEQQLRHAYLQTAIATLQDRERHIFIERRLSENVKTLEELGKLLGISRERVRQLEVRAFEKVQKAIKRAMDDVALEGSVAAATV